jgi:hypothetical protein
MRRGATAVALPEPAKRRPWFPIIDLSMKEIKTNRSIKAAWSGRNCHFEVQSHLPRRAQNSFEKPGPELRKRASVHRWRTSLGACVRENETPGKACSQEAAELSPAAEQNDPEAARG